MLSSARCSDASAFSVAITTEIVKVGWSAPAPVSDAVVGGAAGLPGGCGAALVISSDPCSDGRGGAGPSHPPPPVLCDLERLSEGPDATLPTWLKPVRRRGRSR